MPAIFLIFLIREPDFFLCVIYCTFIANIPKAPKPKAAIVPPIMVAIIKIAPPPFLPPPSPPPPPFRDVSSLSPSVKTEPDFLF